MSIFDMNITEKEFLELNPPESGLKYDKLHYETMLDEQYQTVQMIHLHILRDEMKKAEALLRKQDDGFKLNWFPEGLTGFAEVGT